MKAKDLLKEIVKAYPDVVAIAQDEDESVFIYKDFIPVLDVENLHWRSEQFILDEFYFPLIIEWDSVDWRTRIVTINDLKDEKLQQR